ncbi:hypothetical protein [Prauserella alba]|uniref:Alpha amylase inhibitor n=1 Tax=Prauserella alba TaxID=176898 RepID=A0ABN1VCE7_9PSEU|nr:hypothetical protein [Prauserella alba]MCP2178920.1 hypothetical protein [Prauserella alba]
MRKRAATMAGITGLAWLLTAGAAGAATTDRPAAAPVQPAAKVCHLETINGDPYVYNSWGAPTTCRVSFAIGGPADHCLNAEERHLLPAVSAPQSTFALNNPVSC